MNSRIEKKLSKRIKEMLPNIYKDAYKCEETNVWFVGGGIDYWGEGQDEYTVWEDFKNNFCWTLDFPVYQEGHELEGHPNVDGFKSSTINLFNKVRELQCITKN